MCPDASSPEWPDFQAELRALLGHGRKIEAIQRYREITGAGLKDAKDAVEAVERGEVPASARSELGPELLSLLRDNRKIEAIKRYREATGVGLKEAKDAVEALALQNGIATRGAGCAGVLVVALVLGGLTSLVVWLT